MVARGTANRPPSAPGSGKLDECPGIQDGIVQLLAPIGQRIHVRPDALLHCRAMDSQHR